jgi:hypothetical protein
MLALPHRRNQHLQNFHQQSQPSYPSPPSSQSFSFNDLSQLSSQQEAFNQKLLHDYIKSQQQSYVRDEALPTLENSFMNGAYDFSNPAIRIQQSTPTPAQQLPSTFAHTSMLPAQSATGSTFQNWNTLANNAPNNNQTLQTPRTSKTHQRDSSSSSIGSDGSQYQAGPAGSGYSYVAYSDSLPSLSVTEADSSFSADQQSSHFSNHLPTPSQTPTHDSFLDGNATYNNYTASSSGMSGVPSMNAHLAMKQALMDQNAPEDEVPGFAHSARHSVSDYGHDSPATPHTAQSDDFDGYKMRPSGETLQRVDSWLFNEFLTYDDEPDLRQQQVAGLDGSYYDTTGLSTQSQSIAQAKPNPQLLSPFGGRNPPQNNIVQRALEQANNARSQSPASSVSRGVSPFRHNSPLYQPSTGYSSPRVRVGTAAEARERKHEAEAAHALKHSVQADEDLAQAKTISPKDALLEFPDADDESKFPLFPEGGASEYGNQYNGGNNYSNATQNLDTTTSQQPYQSNNWATPQFAPNFATSTGTSQPAPFAFVPPAIQGNLHGLAYSGGSQYRSTANMPSTSDSVPDFPAHLTSMESSASEAEPQNSQNSIEQLQKPASSAADTGTYTCTYHGCTQRFETPQKLQKHKREGHRNTNAPTVGSSMPSAALLERNSQAGPHKCERINPTTGKPCNTIFSRPYDLTRHEDTIHNVRKQKVRCALCVEDKTFSRNDALTRHMRVVHPEVDFPGKHRRRGGNHD